MVRLEKLDGSPLYVPAEGVALEAEAEWDVATDTFRNVGTRVFLAGRHFPWAVKGTPDEVHAKLFPTNTGGIVNAKAAVEALTWAADETASVPVHLCILARKALGREGT